MKTLTKDKCKQASFRCIFSSVIPATTIFCYQASHSHTHSHTWFEHFLVFSDRCETREDKYSRKKRSHLLNVYVSVQRTAWVVLGKMCLHLDEIPQKLVLHKIKTVSQPSTFLPDRGNTEEKPDVAAAPNKLRWHESVPHCHFKVISWLFTFA